MSEKGRRTKSLSFQSAYCFKGAWLRVLLTQNFFTLNGNSGRLKHLRFSRREKRPIRKRRQTCTRPGHGGDHRYRHAATGGQVSNATDLGNVRTTFQRPERERMRRRRGELKQIEGFTRANTSHIKSLCLGGLRRTCSSMTSKAVGLTKLT